jgi:preprotein translocase subunit SecD
MRNKLFRILLILVILVVVIIIDFPILTGFKESVFKRKVSPILGLDLRGGMQVVLQAPKGYSIDQETLQVAATILENRSNALGVSEVVFQVAGDNYIVGEFPGLENITEVIGVIKQTGMLEFVDVGDTLLAPQTAIQTDYKVAAQTTSEKVTPTPAPLNVGQPVVGSPKTADTTVYHTVITGADLATVVVKPPQNPGDGYAVAFTLKTEAKQVFGDFTKANIGKMLAIVLDKKIVSTPVIRQAIETGEGAISGQGENAYTFDEANNLRITLFYGTLPVALEIAESRVVGPTLGQASLQKSIFAGAIGFAIVSLFMLIYYRAPGFMAIIAIILFGLITFALYLLIPVTLTLPGIAGFLLGVGSALDANILQFERLKEELRKGRTLFQAVDLGWIRAWPSIRDSNLATIITSGILFWFGSSFGATIVKGFALTLALGVAVSLFTALFVTRTLLNLSVKLLEKVDKKRWFGI